MIHFLLHRIGLRYSSFSQVLVIFPKPASVKRWHCTPLNQNFLKSQPIEEVWKLEVKHMAFRRVALYFGGSYSGLGSGLWRCGLENLNPEVIWWILLELIAVYIIKRNSCMLRNIYIQKDNCHKGRMSLGNLHGD